MQVVDFLKAEESYKRLRHQLAPLSIQLNNFFPSPLTTSPT
ncbi:hypothetical protein VCRA217O166_250033 [Vibrio crassostreae]|nr:hypothetical protein EDB50_101505 [Vibrio crassostreae]CAH6780837.1 conserved hypothetical protein [Vibrio chagasii]CDT82190.1 hypothetical protein VCR29J2_680166 [Vibrio coralliirubri]TCT78494.1 hypothetical protein EDB46_10152 [Vibrio crassostreae]CAK2781100.1 hypothetical protein VCRA217O134_10056 [Vibrio crassostreae]